MSTLTIPVALIQDSYDYNHFHEGPGAVPSYANPGDAGADLRSTINTVIEPGGRQLIPTGVAIALPAGTVGLVHPRSGLAHKHGVTVLNAPGTVDSGYRGELKVNLINHGHEGFIIERGDRIAQLVVQRYEHVEFELVDVLDDTERGTGGHGSTGVS